MGRWIRDQHDMLKTGKFEVDINADRTRMSGAGRLTKFPELRQALFDWFVDYREKYARITRDLFRAKAEEFLELAKVETTRAQVHIDKKKDD